MRKMVAQRRSALLACGVSALSLIAFPVAAQEADADGATEVDRPDDENVILVTGTRASWQQSRDIKRNSDVIVDSLVAEDIGKFPDQNLAEALQRITGVSIDRNGGEGRFVTIRGFGPQFSTVTVNGRTLASDNLGREFSFDTLAAEVVSGINVYKTQTAALREGGIGGTIDLLTVKPLDSNEQAIAVSVAGMYDTSSDKIDPQASLFFVDQFADDRIGLAFSLNYQKRRTQTNRLSSLYWIEGDVNLIDPTDLSFPFNTVVGTLEDVAYPQDFEVGTDFEERERITGTAALQFEPTDQLSITLDGIYSDYEVKSRQSWMGFWMGTLSDATVSPNGTLVEIDPHPAGTTDFITGAQNRPTETYQLGANVEYELSDSLSLELDGSYSKSTSDEAGRNYFAVMTMRTAGWTYSNPNGEVPSVTGYVPQDQWADLVIADYVARESGAGGSVEGGGSTDEVYELRADLVWDTGMELLEKIRIGGSFLDRKLGFLEAITPYSVAGIGQQGRFAGMPISVPSSVYSLFTPDGFFTNLNIDVPTTWISFDAEDLISYLQTPAALNQLSNPAAAQAAIDANGGWTAQPTGNEFQIGEENLAAYVQANFGFDVGAAPVDAILGLRYIHTDSTSTGTVSVLQDLTLTPGADTYGRVLGQPSLVDVKSSYDYFLPSATIRAEVAPNFVVRGGITKTLTRPPVAALRPSLDITETRIGALNASGSNPNLSPYLAWNYDLSLEYYYGQTNYIALALFKKDVSNYIVSEFAQETFTLDSGDYVFNVTRPRNAESASIKGLEIALQHTFDSLPEPLDGFGVLLNATFVDSNAEVNSSSGSDVFALEGLSNSFNGVLIYEKGPVSARLAYNYRDKFYSGLVEGIPSFTRSRSQIDFSASYDILENVTIFVEGINITGERVGAYSRIPERFLSLTDSGSRYTVGVRTRF